MVSSTGKKINMNKREIGSRYESIVRTYLEKHNYKIICQNYRTKIGEIDIIAKNENYLCFIEVKYRDKESLVSGLYAVDKLKQKTIYNVANIYMIENGIDDDTLCRFDVVSVDGSVINLIKNAFP